MSISWTEIDDDDESDYANIVPANQYGTQTGTKSSLLQQQPTPTRYSRISEAAGTTQGGVNQPVAATVVARQTSQWKRLGGTPEDSAPTSQSSTSAAAAGTTPATGSLVRSGVSSATASDVQSTPGQRRLSGAGTATPGAPGSVTGGAQTATTPSANATVSPSWIQKCTWAKPSAQQQQSAQQSPQQQQQQQQQSSASSVASALGSQQPAGSGKNDIPSLLGNRGGSVWNTSPSTQQSGPGRGIGQHQPSTTQGSWRRSLNEDQQDGRLTDKSQSGMIGAGARILQRPAGASSDQHDAKATQNRPQPQPTAAPKQVMPQVAISTEREMGVIQMMPTTPNGAGLIFCQSRPTSISFTLADLRSNNAAEAADAGATASSEGKSQSETKSQPEATESTPTTTTEKKGKRGGKQATGTQTTAASGTSTPQLEVGTEVSFNVKTILPANAMSAVDITVLPKGTVVFDEILEENAIGVVVSHLQGTGLKQFSHGQFKFSGANIPTSERGELYGGIVAAVAPVPEGLTDEQIAAAHPGWSRSIVICLQPTSAAARLRGTQNQSAGQEQQNINVNAPWGFMFTGERYEFSERDLRNSLVTHPGGLPLIGDVVMFSHFQETRTGRHGATQISIHDPEPTNRRRGVVKAVYPPTPEHPDGFGFIQLFTTPEEDAASAAAAASGGGRGHSRHDIYFKPADLLVPGSITLGSVVSFTLVSLSEQLASLGGGKEKGKSEERRPRAYRLFPVGRVGTQRRLLKGTGVAAPIATESKAGKDEAKSGVAIKKGHHAHHGRNVACFIHITGLADPNIEGAAPEPPTASDAMSDEELLGVGVVPYHPVHLGNGQPGCVLPGDEVTLRVHLLPNGLTTATDVRLHSLDLTQRDVGVIATLPEGNHPGTIRCLGRKTTVTFFNNAFASEGELAVIRSIPEARTESPPSFTPGAAVSFNVVTEHGHTFARRIRFVDPAHVQFTTSFYALAEVLAVPCAAASGAPRPSTQLEVKLVPQAGEEDLNVAVEAAGQHIAASRRPDIPLEVLREELLTWREKVPAWFKPDQTNSYVVHGAPYAFGFIPGAVNDAAATASGVPPPQCALPGDIVIVRVTCDNESESATVTDSLLVLPSIACSHRGIVIATSAPPPGERHRYGFLIPLHLAPHLSSAAAIAMARGATPYLQVSDIPQIRFSFADVAPSMRASIVPGCQVRFSLLRHAPAALSGASSTTNLSSGAAGASDASSSSHVASHSSSQLKRPGSQRGKSHGHTQATQDQSDQPIPSTPVFVTSVDPESPLAAHGMVLPQLDQLALAMGTAVPSRVEEDYKNGLFQAVRVVVLTAGDAALHASLAARSPLLSAYALALSQHSFLDDRVYQPLPGNCDGYVESLPTLEHTAGPNGPIVRQEPGYLVAGLRWSNFASFIPSEPVFGGLDMTHAGSLGGVAHLARLAAERIPPGMTAESLATRRRVAALLNGTGPEARRIPFFFSNECAGLDVGDSVRFTVAIMNGLLPSSSPIAAHVTCAPKRGVVAESLVYTGATSVVLKLKRIFVTTHADFKVGGDSSSGPSYTEAFAIPATELALFPNGLAQDDCVEFKRILPAGACQYDPRLRSAAGIVKLPRGSVSADLGICLANNEAQRALARSAAATTPLGSVSPTIGAHPLGAALAPPSNTTPTPASSTTPATVVVSGPVTSNVSRPSATPTAPTSASAASSAAAQTDVSSKSQGPTRPNQQSQPQQPHHQHQPQPQQPRRQHPPAAPGGLGGKGRGKASEGGHIAEKVESAVTADTESAGFASKDGRPHQRSRGTKPEHGKLKGQEERKETSQTAQAQKPKVERKPRGPKSPAADVQASPKEATANTTNERKTDSVDAGSVVTESQRGGKSRRGPGKPHGKPRAPEGVEGRNAEFIAGSNSSATEGSASEPKRGHHPRHSHPNEGGSSRRNRVESGSDTGAATTATANPEGVQHSGRPKGNFRRQRGGGSGGAGQERSGGESASTPASGGNK